MIARITLKSGETSKSTEEIKNFFLKKNKNGGIHQANACDSDMIGLGR